MISCRKEILNECFLFIKNTKFYFKIAKNKFVLLFIEKNILVIFLYSYTSLKDKSTDERKRILSKLIFDEEKLRIFFGKLYEFGKYVFKD